MIDLTLQKLFKDYSFTSVLDLGSGEGFEALFAAQHGARVVAVDQKPIPSSCLNNPNIKWDQSKIHEFVIPPNAFDLVILRNIIHFLNREFFITHIAPSIIRSMRSGGWLYLSTFQKQDIIFERNAEGYYTAEELCEIFKPLIFQKSIQEVHDDDHPPYGTHQHFTVTYVGQKP